MAYDTEKFPGNPVTPEKEASKDGIEKTLDDISAMLPSDEELKNITFEDAYKSPSVLANESTESWRAQAVFDEEQVAAQALTNKDHSVQSDIDALRDLEPASISDKEAAFTLSKKQATTQEDIDALDTLKFE